MLEPDCYFETVFDIDYARLWGMGVRGLIFDIDNTLAGYADESPSAETAALLGRLAGMGFRLCLLTNNTGRRLSSFNRELGLPGFAGALKPLPGGVRKAMRAMGVESGQAAIIGDQLFTDVWAGRISGVFTVLVKPVTQKDFALVKIKRLFERLMLRRFFANLEK